MFTTEDDRGTFHDSKKIGGWNGGNEESEVTFDFDEEIIGINGTVMGLLLMYHGSFGGFNGLAGYYIDGIGVYLKASQETARVGLWGTEFRTGPQYRWSFCLEENFKLTKITIDHGDMISSLTFTSEDCMGSAQQGWWL
ncbi:putative jacalin-like lectin domain superfamily [Helianthus anomalus]